jgi:predicted TIM-barrel fold metal-dependent hydrolase
VTVDCHTHWGTVWLRGEAPQWLAVLDAHKVQTAVVMPHAGLVRPDLCAADNDLLASLAAEFPGRLAPLATAWPQLETAGVAEARRALDTLHFRGLKFHPWLQGFSTADPYLGRMCGLAGEYGVPVFFHDGTPTYSLSEQIAGLARRYPRTRIVLAHAGLLWDWRGALAAARIPNIWLCLCGPHQRAIETICRRADPARLVWGSDFGFGKADQVEYRLNLFLRARMPEDLRARILGDNARELLKL